MVGDFVGDLDEPEETKRLGFGEDELVDGIAIVDPFCGLAEVELDASALIVEDPGRGGV